MLERTARDPSKAPLPAWTLITSHGLAVLYVATHPNATVREIATALELTGRRVNDIIRDLANGGLVIVTRQGRSNHYSLSPDARFRHPLLSDVPFRAFVHLMEVVRNEADRQA